MRLLKAKNHFFLYVVFYCWHLDKFELIANPESRLFCLHLRHIFSQWKASWVYEIVHLPETSSLDKSSTNKFCHRWDKAGPRNTSLSLEYNLYLGIYSFVHCAEAYCATSSISATLTRLTCHQFVQRLSSNWRTLTQIKKRAFNLSERLDIL